MTEQQVEFACARGFNLSGIIDTPDGEVKTWAVIAHCFTCNKSVPAVSRIAKSLKRRGIGVLRFDFAGLGASAGSFTESTFSADVEDLKAACKWMQEQGRTPELLIGHSLGGAAVLAAAGDIPSVVAVATVAAPADPGHVAELLKDRLAPVYEYGVAEIQIAGHKMLVGAPLFDDLTSQDEHHERIRNLNAALLVIHSPQDQVVDIHNAMDIYRTANMPKSFIALDGADHLMTKKGVAAWAGEMIAAWADHYVATD
ncbi:MAG: alpha/beta fold hydrolase [Acidobacteriota bacterium]|nr:alpha/beta fold hydrolase [Acidobacteriota bacterium]